MRVTIVTAGVALALGPGDTVRKKRMGKKAFETYYAERTKKEQDADNTSRINAEQKRILSPNNRLSPKLAKLVQTYLMGHKEQFLATKDHSMARESFWYGAMPKVQKLGADDAFTFLRRVVYWAVASRSLWVQLVAKLEKKTDAFSKSLRNKIQFYIEQNWD